MYYHGVVNGLVDKKVLDILDKREICSAARLGLTKRIGFNENDYISICSNMGEEVYSTGVNSAFNKYIKNRFCFVIDDSIEVFKPVYIPDASSMGAIELFNLKRNNPDKRFSDIIDEYQAKDFIPFDKVVAIGIPYNLEVQNGEIRLSNFCTLTVDEFLSLIKKVEDCADRLGIKVVDSSSPEFDLMFEDKKNKK